MNNKILTFFYCKLNFIYFNLNFTYVIQLFNHKNEGVI